MKAFLMYKDHDFDLQQELPSNEQALTQDLELNTLFNAMALGDKFLSEVAKKAVLSGLNNDLATILYRQNILKDCLKNSSIVRDIYDIALEAIQSKKKHYFGIFNKLPSSILYNSIEVLQMLVGVLKKLKNISDEHANKFESEGFTAFFAMLNKELGDEFFVSVQNHLRELKFRDGVLISAELGEGNKGTNYILRKPHGRKQSWMKRIFAKNQHGYTFYISDRDEHGATALSLLKSRGINLVANALAQSTDHILSFFNMLLTELAFYISCLNLHEQLVQMGGAISFPLPVASGERRHFFKGLYDVCLTITMKQKIVGNNVNADNKDLVMITGANQGGKSTFLRSIGLAQLMMECGMFVPAESFSSNVCEGLFTHYKREEDATMKSGKFDEELSRMSGIVNNITSNSMVLFNESFAATNEREGSEIARQIVCALLEKRIKVFFVTHLYEFAHGIFDKKMRTAIFLLAERQPDGGRTFKLIEGEPLQTSYGEDLYKTIFRTDN
ncbi:MAG: DNA mismatch repair protein MutS [Syntrophales bacterium]|jgi:DNA mismatch repair ATPase MutS